VITGLLALLNLSIASPLVGERGVLPAHPYGSFGRASARRLLPSKNCAPWGGSVLRGSEKPLLVEDSRPAPLDLSWLFAAVNEGSNRSSSQQLMKVVSALNSLLKARRFTDLNYMLSKLQPERLSPELMLTFARLTFPVRELLSNWYSFVRKVKKELESREMDSKRMLQGLI
jgi:hypothetical protein